MTSLDYQMGAGIVFITFIIILIGIFDHEQKKRKAERLEKIKQDHEENEKWIQGAKLVAKEYVTDPVLKEWSDFVGDVPKAYLRAELYPFDEFAVNIEVLLEKLSSGELEKIGIVYNDSLSAVVLSVRKKGEDHEKL